MAKLIYDAEASMRPHRDQHLWAIGGMFRYRNGPLWTYDSPRWFVKAEFAVQALTEVINASGSEIAMRSCGSTVEPFKFDPKDEVAAYFSRVTSSPDDVERILYVVWAENLRSFLNDGEVEHTRVETWKQTINIRGIEQELSFKFAKL
jgi:hypothetical protein